jgi:DNA-directed RNA polymerase specialized sigma24 family protein
LVGDVGLAEDLAQGALVAALEQWPQCGVPDKPGGWLMSTAKHHAIDQIRRSVRLERKTQELGRDLEIQQELGVPGPDADIEEDMGDDLLRLIFIACHPILAKEARLALTLRLLGGLSTEEIACISSLKRRWLKELCGRSDSIRNARPLIARRRASGRAFSVLKSSILFSEGYWLRWRRLGFLLGMMRGWGVLAELVPNEPSS